MRLALLYNLVRRGKGEAPRLAVQRTGIADDLGRAGKLWEEQMKDSRDAIQ